MHLKYSSEVIIIVKTINSLNYVDLNPAHSLISADIKNAQWAVKISLDLD